MDAAVGNMIDTLGFERGFGSPLMVAKVGMRVDRSHFSPTEAMEETWVMMCGGGGGVHRRVGIGGYGNQDML